VISGVDRTRSLIDFEKVPREEIMRRGRRLAAFLFNGKSRMLEAKSRKCIFWIRIMILTDA